jgi:hypothetical protein
MNGKNMTDAENIKLPTLSLATIQLSDGGWAVVSGDPSKPLTEEQAENIAAGYIAMAEILARNFNRTG